MPTWFKQWCGHNRGLKLVSLLIAVLVWLWASSQIYIRTSLLVPVSLRLAEGMVARSISPPRAQVILEVPRELGRSKQVDPREIKIVHDISNSTHAGRVVFNLSPHDVTVPYRMRAVSVSPGRVTADIDRLVEKVLPVQAVFQGRPRSGYRIASKTVIPPEVRVSIPKSLEGRIRSVKTRPIYVTGRSNSFNLKTPLEQPGPYSQSLPEPVEVIVTIGPELQASRLDGVSVGVLRDSRQPEQIDVSPGRVTLYLKGSAPIMESLAAADVKAYVDVIGLVAGSYELPLQCRLPAGVVLDRAEPEVVNVNLGRGGVDRRKDSPPG